jgi:hypothetical protein
MSRFMLLLTVLSLCGCQQVQLRQAKAPMAQRTVTVSWSQEQGAVCNLYKSRNMALWTLVYSGTNYTQQLPASDSCCFFAVAATNNGVEVFQQFKPPADDINK